MEFLKTNTLLLTQKALDFQWQKKNLVSDNIANAITPGYKAKYITFEEELRNRLSSSTTRTTDSMRRTIESSRFRVHETSYESQKLDGNNVNIETENIELVRAELQYQYLERSLNDELSRIRMAIKGM